MNNPIDPPSADPADLEPDDRRSVATASAGDQDDVLFEIDELELVDRRSILATLHNRCARLRTGDRVSVAMVSVDGLAPLTREQGPHTAARVQDEAFTRISRLASASGCAGVLDEEMLLMVLDGWDADASATALDDLRAQAGRIRLGTRAFAVSFSAAVTPMAVDDLPEAIVGRLSRAVQRVMMGGGDRTERVD